MIDQPSNTIFNLLWKMLPKMYLYVGSTGSLTVGVAAQFLTAVILARYLGIEQFGQLMTITAATAVGAQLCGLGAGETMVRRIARDPAVYRVILGHSLIVFLISGAILTPIIATVLYFMVGVSSDPFESMITILIFTVSSIILFRCVVFTEQIFLGRRQFWHANAVQIGFAVARILTVLTACIVFKIHRLESWILWHGVMHLAAALVCVAALSQYGAPRWRFLREEFNLGIHQTTPWFFDTLQQNIDILVLNLVAPPAIVGSYGAASRLVRQSNVMIGSVSRLFYPRLAVTGEHGVLAVRHLVTKYLRYALLLGAMTSVGLFFVAPPAVKLFGTKFHDAIVYIRILCWLPCLIAIIHVYYDALGATDEHYIRANVYNIGCIAGAVLIGGSTYMYGLRGTFIAIYVGYVLILSAIWATYLVLTRKELHFHRS